MTGASRNAAHSSGVLSLPEYGAPLLTVTAPSASPPIFRPRERSGYTLPSLYVRAL